MTNKFSKIIDFIDLRIKELKNAKDINQINSIRVHIKINLEADLSEIPEVFYFYIFREKTDNFEIAASKDIETLGIIINLLKKIDLKTVTNIKIIELKKKLSDLLKSSEVFNDSLDDDQFILWEEELKEVLDNYKFKIDVHNDFQRNKDIEYKKFHFYDGKNHLTIIDPFLQDRIEHQRNLILRIIKNLIEKGSEIFAKVKRDKFRCFLTDSDECSKKIKENDNQVFLAFDYNDEKVKSVMEYIKEVLRYNNIKPIIASEKIVSHDFMCKICELIQESKYLLADISSHNLNVGLELGIAIGLNKKTMLISDKNSPEIGDLKRTDSIRYGDDMNLVKKDFQKMLQNILE